MYKFITLLWIISCPLLAAEDFSLKFNQYAKEACSSSISRTIYVGNGEHHFMTPLDPFPCALNIVGDGIGSTTLIRDFQGGAFFHWMRGTDHSGGSIKDLTILAGKGTNNGIAIYVQADKDTDSSINSYNRHTFTISGIIIGRESGIDTSWNHGIYLDGALNSDNTEGIAAGIRMTQVINTTISGTNVSQIYLNKARGINLLNVDCFIPLNGSINGVLMDNVTQGVKLDSRTCAWKFQDAESIWVVYNGIRFK
jgi:hypothetical protein